jgi:CRP-like cAMP-binding protein
MVHSHFRIKEFGPGQVIIPMGRPLRAIYLLVKGKVRIFTALESGETVLLSMDTPFTILGSVEIMHNWPAIAQVEAVEPTTCFMLSSEDFRRYGEEDPGLLALLVRDLAKKVLDTDMASAAKNVTAIGRLAWYLLSQGSEEITYTTKLDLASFLGTSERHLSRLLLSLEREDVIRQERKKIRILRRDALEELGPDAQ